MITTIPAVKISGINYPVYGIDFQNGGDEPSTLTVNYVNKDGSYNPPALQTKTPTKITIGSFFSFEGFPVTTSLDERPNGGKILKVTYKDTSIILDNYFIGLRSKFGEGFGAKVSGSFDNIILLGRQVDPCTDIQPEDQYDPASPCQDRNNSYQKKFIDCERIKDLQLLDIVYSFDDFLDAISSSKTAFVKLNNRPKTLNSIYYARYTGTVREVLRLWCNDYGFTFFWDAGGITFVDLRSGIKINDANVYSNCALLSRLTENSIEDTVNRGLITYFGKEGGYTDYTCGHSARRLMLRPLTLEDIFIGKSSVSTGPVGSSSSAGSTSLDATIKKYYGSSGESNSAVISRLEGVITLGLYAERLRDLYIWFYKEGIRTAADADGKKGKTIGLMGNMKIIEVFHADSRDSKNQEIYNKLLSKSNNKDIIKRLKDKKVYFVQVQRNPILYKSFRDFENGMASEFMGKYWLRYYTDSPNSKPSISAPDGNAQYFKDGQEFNFPFLQLLPSSVDKLKTIFDDLVKSGGQNSPDKTYANDSFILLDRPPAWYPLQNSPNTSDILKSINDIEFTAIGEDNVSKVLTGDDTFYMISEAPKSKDFDIEPPVLSTNPLDEENVDIRTVASGYSTSFGLRSARCKKYKIKTKAGDLDIFTPSQSYGSGTGNGGYVVIIDSSQNKGNSRVMREKFEKILGNVVKKENYIALDVLFRDVTQDIFKILKYHTDDNSKYKPGTVEYREDVVDKLLEDFAKGLAPIQEIPSHKITYEIAGFPSIKKSLSDGLESFTLRYGGSDGVKTSVSFSNIPKRKISDSIIIREIEKNNSVMGILNKQNLLNQTTAPLRSTDVGVGEIID